MRTSHKNQRVNPVEALLEAGLKIISREGLFHLTHTRLAKETGLSKQLAHYHFPKLDTLLLELFKKGAIKGQELTGTAFQSAKNNDERLLASFRGAFQWSIQFPDYAKLFFLTSYWATLSPALSQNQKLVFQAGYDRIKLSILESMQFSTLAEAETAALHIHHLLLGTLVKMISTSDFSQAPHHWKHLILGVEKILDRKMKHANYPF